MHTKKSSSSSRTTSRYTAKRHCITSIIYSTDKMLSVYTCRFKPGMIRPNSFLGRKHLTNELICILLVRNKSTCGFYGLKCIDFIRLNSRKHEIHAN